MPETENKIHISEALKDLTASLSVSTINTIENVYKETNITENTQLSLGNIYLSEAEIAKKYVQTTTGIDEISSGEEQESAPNSVVVPVSVTKTYSNNPDSSDSDSGNWFDKASNYIEESFIGDFGRYLESNVDDRNKITGTFTNILDDLSGRLGSLPIDMGDSSLAYVGESIAGGLVNACRTLMQSLTEYNDGATETVFGGDQEKSWRTLSAAIKSSSAKYKINVVESTPLNSENGSLYGTMIMGAPMTFNNITDPKNRVMLNTFVKDAKFLSLTPGVPKYTGSHYIAHSDNDIKKQTQTPNEMLDYLLKNGVDGEHLSKDKRYYTFQAAYGKYYSYLETMLNAIWIKLGLGTEGDGTFNMMTFFDGLNTSEDADPKSQYCNALGFFVNPVGSVAENISNEKTGFGSNIGSDTNNASENYQMINYLTGMGTGTALQTGARTAGIVAKAGVQVKEFVSDKFSHFISGFRSGQGKLGKVLKAGLGALWDVAEIATTQDVGAQMQAFAVTNGMKVMYPELWADGSYSKSMTFDFNFVSPYGDPLSIFKYVYVPFCCLLCMTLPRQADANGYVSPFFVRADMPGVVTCDLGFISNMSYTRGGGNGLFTKDGLPRAISGSFTVEDLYPYLAMSRRISFLSANPSYTSFIDSMIGLNAVYSENNTSALGDYWKNMLNRVNGSYSGGLWNRYNSEGRALHKEFISSVPKNKFTTRPKSINWFNSI